MAQQGETRRAVELLQRARAMDPEDSHVLYNVACGFAQAGEVGLGLDCLEKAVQNGFGHREWLENDTDLDPLRADPRFDTLLRQM
jgi:hypothetical protein